MTSSDSVRTHCCLIGSSTGDEIILYYAVITTSADTSTLVEDTLATVPLTLSDTITQAVLETYDSVMESRPEKKPWKVLAGESLFSLLDVPPAFQEQGCEHAADWLPLMLNSENSLTLPGLVATIGPSREPVVLCLTTGTKCVSGQCLSMSGNSVFDCHGEILARRCFKFICYAELLRLKHTLKNGPDNYRAPRLLELDP